MLPSDRPCQIPPSQIAIAERTKKPTESSLVLTLFETTIRRTSGFGKSAIAGVPIRDL